MYVNAIALYNPTLCKIIGIRTFLQQPLTQNPKLQRSTDDTPLLNPVPLLIKSFITKLKALMPIAGVLDLVSDPTTKLGSNRGRADVNTVENPS